MIRAIIYWSVFPRLCCCCCCCYHPLVSIFFMCAYSCCECIVFVVFVVPIAARPCTYACTCAWSSWKILLVIARCVRYGGFSSLSVRGPFLCYYYYNRIMNFTIICAHACMCRSFFHFTLSVAIDYFRQNRQITTTPWCRRKEIVHGLFKREPSRLQSNYDDAAAAAVLFYQ